MKKNQVKCTYFINFIYYNLGVVKRVGLAKDRNVEQGNTTASPEIDPQPYTTAPSLGEGSK